MTAERRELFFLAVQFNDLYKGTVPNTGWEERRGGAV